MYYEKPVSTMPIFSVVIPIYKVEKYIAQCLRSVLAQTYSNFEVICVDDGSPDHSVAIVKSFKDSRIRIIQQKNMGLAAARNTGINASRGLYIALLDSDDFWHEDKLIKHYKHLSANGHIGISYSASAFVDEAGKLLGIGQHPKLKGIQAKDIFCRNPIGNGSAPVIRKALFNRLARQARCDDQFRNVYFDESMRQSEDVEFWLRAALSTDYYIEGIADTLTYYRVNMSGLSSKLDEQYQAWLYAAEQQRRLAPEFIDKWFSLAAAYQLRYLARRAVQARDSKNALRLLVRALKSDLRLLTEDPLRTLSTAACAILSAAPNKVYTRLEKFAMGLSSKRHAACTAQNAKP